MQNFQLIASNVDCFSVNHQLKLRPNLWDKNKLRTTYPDSPHAQVSDIWVWFNSVAEIANTNTVINDIDCIPYPAWKELPALRPLIFGLMRNVEAVRLGRVIITKLAPGKEITPHADHGAPATYYSRYQIALQCLPGNIFNIDGEEISFKTGDIWWIDNKKTHSVRNNSADDRIVCIVDLRVE